jgi:A/G-specific adenine glycosylase
MKKPVSKFRPFSGVEAKRFRQHLLRWYDANQRDLPWRSTRDPYRIWVSEIMLQQTRVAAVVEYYHRFLEAFPTLQALADAPVAAVLACWSGLGYYRRARLMHQAAQDVVKRYQGYFPQSGEELRILPGIGKYTSAAIASIAFGEPVAVVDGNVERVIQRVYGTELSTSEIRKSAEVLLSRRRPGDFNQGLMELGAVVCLPRDPKCLLCPVATECKTRGELDKPKRERRRKRDVDYVLDSCQESVYLVQRPNTASLMPGMWELPEVAAPVGKHRWNLKHSITVTDYTVRVSEGLAPPGVAGCRVARAQLASMPLTGLTRKILRQAGIIQ